MSAPRTWTSAETAAYLSITENALRRLRSRGDGPPFIKIGRTVRYAPAHVAQWIQANTHTSTKEAARG